MAHKKLFLLIVGLPIVLILLLAGLMIFNNIRTFDEYYNEQIQYREKEYLSMYKKEIYDNVGVVLKIIEYEHQQIEKELKKFLQEQLNTAVNVAEEIYSEYKDTLPQDEIKAKIVKQLSRMRYNGGRGYFYIHEYSTNTVIGHPIEKYIGLDFSDKIDEYGNNIIAVQKAAIKDSKIGFAKLYFNKPEDTSKEYPKLVCVTRFEPLDLLIGTGEYLDMIQQQIQEKVLREIAILNQRYGDKFIFVYKLHNINGGKDFASRLLTVAKGISSNVKLDSRFKDAKGFPYRETMLEELREKGESYIKYWFPDRKTQEAKQKHSYFYWQKDWDWIIGCGFYYDQYNSDIQNIELIFKTISDKYLKINMLIIAGILLIVLIVSFYLMSKLTKTIQHYLDEISSLNTRLEKSSRAKSQFLANMSHEIRTPLHGIIGLNDILLNTPVTQRQKDYLLKSKQASRALMNVINDILDYSKIEAGKLSISRSEFNLNEMLDNISNLFGFMIYDKGLEFCFRVDPDIPIILVGDSQRLTQILNNFIGNSTKFTHRGHISVDIALLRKNEETVLLKFQVCDTGIGISESNLKKIFQPFEQGDSSTTKTYGGTGLGLMISKQLIEMMNGQLFFESRENKGSCFGFTIELGYSTRAENARADSKRFQDAKFLIAEDMDEQRDYLVNILESWGIRPAQARNGKEALYILEREAFDYIILDWKMPEMDGIALLKAMKEKNISIPNILMITAYDKDDMDEQAMKSGVDLDKILFKPYTPSCLFETLFDEKAIRPADDHARSIKLVSPARLLLVEDNATNTLVAQNIFERIGFSVDTAENGKEAVSLASENSYDIIFMDIQMPVMDGYEATQKIRKFDVKTPVIALSAAAMQDDKQQAREKGMDYHMSKPIDMKELEYIIEQYFPVMIMENSIPPDVELVSVDGIDIEKLYISIGDADKAYQMLNGFREGHKKDSALIDGMDSGSREFKSYIHKLKGSSGNLKMMQIYDTCRAIETELDREKLSELVEKLKKLIESVVDGIEQKITPLTNASDDISPEKYRELCTSIVESVKHSSLIKSSVIYQIENHLLKSGEKQKAEQLVKAFTEKDLNRLRELLEKEL